MKSKREDDLKMLASLLDEHGDELKPNEKESFEDMRSNLSDGQHQLTAKQRDWVKKKLEDFIPEYENLASTGKVAMTVKHNHSLLVPCTANCPAWTPPSLRNLPKKPPQKRVV